MHVTLYSCHLRRVLLLQMHYVEDILPEIVVFRYVVEEASTVFVELLPIKIADIAEVILVTLNFFFLFSQLGKSIDNYTEQNIQ